jgi:hypothetical protein
MAFQTAQLPFKLTPEDMGHFDLMKALSSGQQYGQKQQMFPQDLQKAMLANALQQYKVQQEGDRSQYYPRLNLAETLKAEAEPREMNARTGLYGQQAKYYGRDIESQMALRAAQGGLAGSETEKNRFLVQNPQYISAEGALIGEAMKQSQANQGGQGGQQSQSYGSQGQSGIPAGAPSQMPQAGQPSAPAGGQMASQGGQPQAAGNQLQPTVDSQRYNPNALAFNPPSLQSPTGNPALDNMYYKKFGMSPVVQAELELSQNQAKLYQDANLKQNTENRQQAILANQSTIDAHKFLDALDRSRSIETGAIAGRGLAVSNAAQEMESAGANMVTSAAKLFQNQGAVHAADIDLQNMAKPSRRQNKDVSFDLAQGIIAKNNRVKERQQFDAYGTQLNIKPEIRDALFSQYETERPYINTETKMPNDAYNGTWKEYLTPEAVNAYIAGINYTPSSQAVLQGMNWSKSDLKNIKSWAARNRLDASDFEKKNLYKLAKNENMTLSQLKSWLMSRGALKNGN